MFPVPVQVNIPLQVSKRIARLKCTHLVGGHENSLYGLLRSLVVYWPKNICKLMAVIIFRINKDFRKVHNPSKSIHDQAVSEHSMLNSETVI